MLFTLTADRTFRKSISLIYCYGKRCNVEDLLVYGIGVNDNKYQANKEGKAVKEYKLYCDMLRRCTYEYQQKRSAYTGVSCTDSFKSYTFFYEWCNNQIGFNNKDSKGMDWQLDKDLLVKGNKVYSEDNCVFVPRRINTLLTNRNASRGDWPLGVRKQSKNSRFNARCNNGTGESKHLGYFDTAQEAFLAYKTFKEALIKEVANEYKEQIDLRVYNVLMVYEVNVND